MEITIRHVVELSPALEALVRRLIGGGMQDGPGRAVGVAEALGAAAVSPAAPEPPPPVLPGQNAPAAADVLAQRKAQGGRGYRTPARRAVLERAWLEGRWAHEIMGEMNLLPGPKIEKRHLVGVWARDLHLKRPEGWDRKAARAAGWRGRAERLAMTAPGATAGATWGDVLAWADTVDPDLVLRGTPQERLAQINELRALEGLPAFTMPRDMAA